MQDKDQEQGFFHGNESVIHVTRWQKSGKKEEQICMTGLFLNIDKLLELKVAGFIANRIAFHRSRGKEGQSSFSRFIIRLSMAATIIGVTVMIVTLALANGFQETISQKIFSFWGHIRIQERQPDKAVNAEELPISRNDSLVREISHLPGVASIHPFATKYAILKTAEEVEGVLLKGLDTSYDFNHIRRFLVEGRPVRYNDSTYSRDILISTYTASRLKLKLNDRILVYFFRPTGEIRPDKLTIAGIYKTGIEEYDRTFGISDIRLIQQKNNWDSTDVGGYEIFIDDYKKTGEMSDAIFEMDQFPPTWNTITAREISPNIFDWLNMQNVTRSVLIGFMIVVAVINLITCLIILVLERTRMVGVLKALGATDWTVQKIFLRHALLITLTGILAGTMLALGLLWLQETTGFIKLPEDAYYIRTAAVKIVWWEVAIVCGGTFLVCLLVLLLPTILVKKVQPVRAIQFR
jgi:lipoprotein-releasing system permease protein